MKTLNLTLPHALTPSSCLGGSLRLPACRQRVDRRSPTPPLVSPLWSSLDSLSPSLPLVSPLSPPALHLSASPVRQFPVDQTTMRCCPADATSAALTVSVYFI